MHSRVSRMVRAMTPVPTIPTTQGVSAMTESLDVARCVALRLDERLARKWSGQTGESGNGLQTDDDPLAGWRRIHGSEPSLFDRRLRWDGLEESYIAKFVSAPREPPHPVAPWATFLMEACHACDASADEADRAQDASDPLPFEEVLLPFLHVARHRLRRVIPDLDRILLPSAQVSSERVLLRELAKAAEQTLFAEFAAMRATHGGPGLRFDGPPRALYRRFIRTLKGARLKLLIERYPVLARLLAVRSGFWVEASKEFVGRLETERDGLAKTFGIDPLTPVAYLRSGLGDSHCRGRSVTWVRFASGDEVVYKPRPLSIDVAFYGLLEWLNARGLTPCQRTLRVLDRGTHGWVEPVAASSMSTDREVKSYFEKAGGLLAVAYVLGASDLHIGNVISAGSDPIPVDLETIMGASGDRPEHDPTDGVSPLQGRSNVLRTCLLPFWLIGPDGWEMREGGMGGGNADEIRAVVKSWHHPNTDWMVQRDKALVARGSHRARRDGEIPTPVDHLEDIVRGFEQGYALLQRNRSAILSDRGPLAAFRGCHVRVMLRNTRIYHSVLRRSLHPVHVKDGLDHSLQFEVLRSSLLRRAEPIAFWQALGSEQRDLENLDYPVFSMAADGLDLCDARARKVGTYGAMAPHDDTTGRIAGLSDNDRRHQAALIRFSFSCLSGPRAPERPDANDKKLADRRHPVSEAQAIGRVIESLVLRGPRQPACWVGSQWSGRELEYELRPLDHTLYDGSIGVALFLVALDAVAATGHRDLAAEALLPLRRTLRDGSDLAALADRTGIGIAQGLGGIVYALTQIGRLTGDARWLDDACLAAHAIDTSRVRSDQSLEVLKGVSGALLGLLSLHALTGERSILKRAIECGERILGTTNSFSFEVHPRWESVQAGFAHGIGGISAALARLARVTRDERFALASHAGFRRAAADDGDSRVEGESSRRNGRFPMAETSSHWRHTWCNGNIGTELGHLHYGSGSFPATSAASDTTIADLGTADHPCCGNLGRAELFLSAGRASLARDIADRVVERAHRNGSYGIAHGLPDARWAPGFFQGLCGIGYQLLRTSAPDRLPCILAFE